MRKWWLLFFVFFIVSSNLFSQAYKIKVRMNGLSDTTVLLGYHFRDKIYMVDSIRLNDKGIGYAIGEKKLTPGQYLLYLPNNKYFDVLIDDDQKFFVRNNAEEFVSDFVVRGSKSNKLLKKFYQKIDVLNKELNACQKGKMNAQKNNQTDSVNYFNSKISSLQREQRELQEKIKKDDSDLFFYSFMKATLEPSITEEMKEMDSLQQYIYYKNHYLDYIDFTDERLIRTNYLYSRINTYLTRVVYQHYDSIAMEAGKIIQKTTPGTEMRKFVSEHLLGFFAVSKYMTHRNVFVYIAENFYLNGKSPWATQDKLEKIRERVSSIKPTLVDQVAPDLRVYTDDMVPTSLHELVADYTILFIYEPECGHCKKATSEIKKLAEDYWKDGVEVFALYSLVDTTSWKHFIREQEIDNWNNVFDPDRTSNFYDLYNVVTTPKIFLLDNRKRIILSDVGIEQIRNYFKVAIEK